MRHVCFDLVVIFNISIVVIIIVVVLVVVMKICNCSKYSKYAFVQNNIYSLENTLEITNEMNFPRNFGKSFDVPLNCIRWKNRLKLRMNFPINFIFRK